MKPVSLKIKGLNSFVEQQTVEFSKLTEKGLFGIFGPTASGKSTILDGITIALYGKVSRDTKEFVNTETNVVEISFDFEIGLGRSRTSYRAERCIKRLKTGNFKTAYARLIEINKENTDENKVIAEGPRDVEENIISIIGLKAEDFTRSVVLPQGKFNEFLKLTGKERRDMLERIFALEKYGSKLYDKIKKVRNENLNTKTLLEGEMKGYENVDEESHNQLKQTLLSLKEEEKEIKLQKSTLDKEYEVYKNIFELQQEKSQYVIKEELLKLQEEDIENKKVKFTKGSLALNVKPYIENVSETQKSLTINGEKLQKLIKDYEFISQKLDSTKISYEEAWKSKNDKLPTLIEKEVSLKQASNIEEKIIYLANEKDILLEKHREVTHNIVEKNSKTSIILINKEKIEQQLQSCETKLNEIEILPEYREKLYKTYNSELEVTSATKNVNELKNKGETLKKTLSSTELLHNKATFTLKDKQNKLELLEEKSVELANDFPGDNNLLLEKQEVYNTLKVKLEKAVEDHKIKDELKDKYGITNIKNEKVRLNIKNVEKSIETMKDKVEKLEGEIKEIEIGNMAVVLASNLQEGDLCPVCGADHHPKVAELKADTNLKGLKSLKQSVETNLENILKDYQKELIKLAGFSKDEEYMNNQLLEVTEKLKDINIKELEEEKKRSEVSLLQFKEKIELYNKQKAKLEVIRAEAREEKSKVAMDEAKLGEGLRKESEALLDLQNDISIAGERLELLSQSHKLLNDDLLREEDSFKQKQNENEKPMSIKEKILQIKNIDNEVIKLTSQVRKDRTALVTLEKETVDIDKTLRELTNLKTEIETSGKEKRAEIERLTLQIVELCGFTPTVDHTPKIEVEKVRAQIKDITLKESTLKAIFERENIEKQNVLTQKTSEENKKEMLSKMLLEGQEKLNISLKENSFEDTETVLLHSVSRGVLVIFEKEIKQYEELKRNLIDNLKRLEILLQGKEVDVTLFEELKEKREVIGTVLEEKTKAIGAQFRALEDMERSLREIKTLLTKKKSVEHKLGLLKELDTLIQGNKFVEYVAMKQLKYISMEASKRLKEITRGRYALELDANGAFVMRDDFNGGIRRETNTLSGGETFLTSLCLALALSSQIQLKGSAPLEFFFLDEGFGTLDTDLLDVVMNSLEKLHSSTLSVGIISHVEELRNRVPIKLIVTPAEQGQGGSKVKLEYT
ncbi:exonuclease [Clostridium estertheticum]|uniref:Exonuclease n=1 Tax=Clostridium estertheticum TaxID=238834 RepID=A0AA47EII1_9CLOT|nr:AAA family ATPase [Clostridium estertheticum]MBU3155569.1 exonuclease [Clostridium estertheticum]MBU3198092.1 exonuclease [Clostridium estertheticum]WAG60034.1 exonuclease [Clostridium estertheticum]WAG65886.1 exonuclease [Clostridium estertheticum]